MNSSPADTIVPLSVISICAAALALVAQLGPDTFANISPPNASSKEGLANANPGAAAAKTATVTMPKLSWLPQPPVDEPLTRIGFGSCLHQDKPQPIWRSVVTAKPQVFLMLGDNVYGDFVKPAGDKLIAAYNQQAANPDFAKARAVVPMLATWDDHDYGRNDGGKNFKGKSTAAKLFRRFWDGSGSLRGRRGPGIAYAQTFGPKNRRLQIIMLDTRSFRSELLAKSPGMPGKGRYQPDPGTDKTILGDAQWQWLEARLKEPAELRLIASSIQVLAQGHRWERWGNIPNEQTRLLELLDSTTARGVIFLSGDRHRSAFYRKDRNDKPPVIEATSSSLNYSFPDPAENGPHQLTPMFGKDNFGMITVDWDAQVLTLTLRGVDGITARALAVPFSRLR